VTDDLVLRVANKAGIQVVSHGPLDDLIPFASAHRFAETAEALGLRILGIDGFYQLPGDRVMPEMRAITDLSSVTSASEAAKAAVRFLEDLADPRLSFEFTLEVE